MATPTTGAVANAAHEAATKVFPPFDASTFAPQLIWFALAFGVIYWMSSKLILPRVGGILADRARRISSDLDEAAAMKAKAEEAGAAYEKALAEARAKAQATAQEARDAATAAGAEKRKALEAELAARIAKSEAQITAMKAKAMSNVSGIAADAAASIVERLTGTAPAKADVTKAVEAVVKG